VWVEIENHVKLERAEFIALNCRIYLRLKPRLFASIININLTFYYSINLIIEYLVTPWNSLKK
jgi:hypothetical protein